MNSSPSSTTDGPSAASTSRQSHRQQHPPSQQQSHESSRTKRVTYAVDVSDSATYLASTEFVPRSSSDEVPQGATHAPTAGFSGSSDVMDPSVPAQPSIPPPRGKHDSRAVAVAMRDDDKTRIPDGLVTDMAQQCDILLLPHLQPSSVVVAVVILSVFLIFVAATCGVHFSGASPAYYAIPVGVGLVSIPLMLKLLQTSWLVFRPGAAGNVELRRGIGGALCLFDGTAEVAVPRADVAASIELVTEDAPPSSADPALGAVTAVVGVRRHPLFCGPMPECRKQRRRWQAYLAPQLHSNGNAGGTASSAATTTTTGHQHSPRHAAPTVAGSSDLYDV